MKNTNKGYYKELVTEVFEKEIDVIIEDLKLPIIPSLTFDDSIPYIMAVAFEIIGEHKLFSPVYTNLVAKTDGIIRVNLDLLIAECTVVRSLARTEKSDYDVVYALLCHECRHIWQTETQWRIVEDKDIDANCLYSCRPTEIDANKYMFKCCSDTKERRAIADYLELSTSKCGGISIDGFQDFLELRDKAFAITKAYNEKAILVPEAIKFIVVILAILLL